MAIHSYQVLAALACVLLGAVADYALRTRVRRLRLWWRFRRARSGQDDAEAVLTRSGYRIVARQTQTEVVLLIDGERTEAVVQADLVVERRGRRSVVEVKTGRRAPDPMYIPTRRQLLEYAIAYPGYDVILVDMEDRCCRTIRFPDLEARQATTGTGWMAAAAFAAGLLAQPAWAWLLHMSR